MTPELLFEWANPLALVGWLALAFWSSSTGGFDSLDAVARLFDNRWLLLAGWVH
jgi:hypothetical protein